MTIKDIIKKYQGKIDQLDLEILIAHSLGETREFVLTYPEYKIPGLKMFKLKYEIRRRILKEPLAYILKYKEFYGLNFFVNKNTLVPRPETEMLVENILKVNPKNKTIIDIGTGSGCIIISLAKNLKNENEFIAIDASKKALQVAFKNARKYDMTKKINFLNGNLLSPVLKSEKNKTSPSKEFIIVANLPYIDDFWKNLDSCSAELKHEPPMAFIGGIDGLDLYRELSIQIKELLTANRIKKLTAYFEIGHLQKKEMTKIFSFATKTTFQKDLAGKWRVCEIEIKN
ncbi:MAG: peptide chain release factor N(5)-glutamine methyltransferase [Candidatus Moranbacteria bacterium]|nr:peptide chain release factor N(5)-glutamine methyltransferase [Candidatus Moranbacteria bacterium]